MRIGPYQLASRTLLAPMAGVTDRPFRRLCRTFGAGLAVSEMISADPRLRDTAKSRRRADHADEAGPVVVQLTGADPTMLAEAARRAVDEGAEIVDLNMGCPTRKVCSAWCGSALLRDEALVGRILAAVVAAAGVPVTLKIRTGWDRSRRNAVAIARIAEAAGVQALAVHGRTRADAFRGEAEYRTIARVKVAVAIPVIANGDITTPERARSVLECTGADAVMIGRAAQGRPWIFREIDHYLRTGRTAPPPDPAEVGAILTAHLEQLYAFYGEYTGVRVARRHIGWYVRRHPGGAALRALVNRAGHAVEQLALVTEHFAARSDEWARAA